MVRRNSEKLETGLKLSMNKNSVYKWLLFDADGTVFDYDKSEEYALKKTLEYFDHSFKTDYLISYHCINEEVWKEHEKGVISKEELKIERFIKLFGEYGIRINPEIFSKDYLKNLAQTSFLLPDAEETLAELFNRYRMIIITNGFKEIQRPRFDKSSIKKYFEKIIVSDEINAAKPNTEYFDAVFKEINYPDKKEVLVIGDGLTSDIQGGINYELDTCWVNRGSLVNDTGLNIKYEIAGLAIF